MIHPSLTINRIVRAVKRGMRDDSYSGFCTACGRKAKQPCEPDARGYICQYTRCSSHSFTVGLEEKFDRSDGLGGTVYGAEELLLMMAP